MRDHPDQLSATEFSGLEAFVRAKLGTDATCKISTVQLARALDVSPESSVRLYDAYNRSSGRAFEFTDEWSLPENPFHRRLVVRRIAADRGDKDPGHDRE